MVDLVFISRFFFFAKKTFWYLLFQCLLQGLFQCLLQGLFWVVKSSWLKGITSYSSRTPW